MESKKNINILILNGSPHKESSKTMHVSNAFTNGLANQFMETGSIVNVETVNIADMNITPCMGCLSCWGRTEGECVIKDDDIPALKKKVDEADILIASFPLYFFGLPGQAKVCLDRLLGMLCTYRGQKAPENGESFHGIRNPKPERQFVIISSCAYTQAEEVYVSLIKQFECICGRDHFTAICCPQLQTLVDVGHELRLRRYLSKFEAAGKEFAIDGSLSSEALAKLNKPPFPEDTYKILLDNFWEIQKMKDRSPTCS